MAVMQCKTVSHKMAELSRDSIIAAMDLFNVYEEDKFNYVDKLESKIDRYEDALGAYIVKLSGLDVSNAESKEISMILHNIGDLERISDHAMNVAETAQELHNKKLSFSDDAKAELNVFMTAVKDIVSMSIESFNRCRSGRQSRAARRSDRRHTFRGQEQTCQKAAERKMHYRARFYPAGSDNQSGKGG